ncbi:MAG TPA: 50S ribosomal protein L4 [Nitrospiraceae bacterium]|jgi:large subunit ribosomal protein L4|nr:50S ribosomal protein L4 [Nitrospiraceae bacterium]
MPTVDVVDLNKRKVGTVVLPEEVFGCKPQYALVHEAVVMQLACERQGTASTLRRGEVSGSGKKPWKQKHTGRARAGSIRSPLWRHGGTVFGPKPRSYAVAMPKRKYRAALQSALSARLSDGGVTVVSDFVLAEPKTKLLAKVLAGLGLLSSTLIVAGESHHDLARAARNLPAVKLVRPEELNVYDVLRYDAILIPERELARVKEAWS